ncbi:MAG: anti-sigma factor [Bacteroidota bacterium]
MKKLSYLFLTALAITVWSCDDDEETTTPATGNLTFNIEGLENLGASFVYEGWVMVDGTPISTGTFTVNDAGQLSQTSFEVEEQMLDAATTFILTIEPAVDPDPAPSDQKYIAGDFSGDMAVVSTAVAPAVGDFSASAGTYFLRTPTDEEPGTGNNGNDFNGVWFGLPGMPPSANLTLPTLPTGWIYEGWLVTENGPISTGTFTDVADRDNSNSLSGIENNAGPAIPGEDFFIAPDDAVDDFPIDVRGNMVVITVEPVPDNDPGPFTLKPLASMVAADAATAPGSHSFSLNVDNSFPSGWVGR